MSLEQQKLITEALNAQELVSQLQVVESGEGALEYLQHSKTEGMSNTRPDLILLDLNMPGMDGKDFLKRVKADDELCSIPVVVLTISNSENDVQESYRLNAAGYIQKPINPKELQKTISKLIEYWFVVCK